MPILHMQTDQVWAVGLQLASFSNLLKDQISVLAGSCNSLESQWDGASSEQFMGETRSLLGQLNHVAQNGQELSRRLEREVDEWARVASALSAAATTGDSTNPGDVPEPGIIDRGETRIFENIVNDLRKTPAGRDLLEEAERLGIRLRLPDGSFIGTGEKIVDIDFGNTDYWRAPGQYDDQQITVNPNPLVTESPLSTLAHEIQHAIDEARGLVPSDAEFSEAILANQDNPVGLQRTLEDFMTQQVAYESRAYGREWAIANNKPFVDDGVLTPEKVDYVMDHKNYQDIYSDHYNSIEPFASRYTVKIDVVDGRIVCELTPKAG